MIPVGLSRSRSYLQFDKLDKCFYGTKMVKRRGAVYEILLRSSKVDVEIVESHKRRSSEANVDKMLRLLKCQMTTTEH